VCLKEVVKILSSRLINLIIVMFTYNLICIAIIAKNNVIVNP
jgi:hypothetical protein